MNEKIFIEKCTVMGMISTKNKHRNDQEEKNNEKMPIGKDHIQDLTDIRYSSHFLQQQLLNLLLNGLNLGLDLGSLVLSHAEKLNMFKMK